MGRVECEQNEAWQMQIKGMNSHVSSHSIYLLLCLLWIIIIRSSKWHYAHLEDSRLPSTQKK